MKRKFPVWIIIFHLLVLFAVLDYVPTGNSSAISLFVALVSIIGAVGAFYRRQKSRIFFFILLCIPALLACYSIFETLYRYARPPVMKVTCYGFILDEPVLFTAGLAGTIFVFPLVLIWNISKWDYWFYPQEQIVFSVILVTMIALTLFDVDWYLSIGERLEEIRRVEIRKIGC